MVYRLLGQPDLKREYLGIKGIGLIVLGQPTLIREYLDIKEKGA